MRARLAACTLFVFVLTSFASTPSNASLNGTYSFELSGAHMNSWGQNLNCGGTNVFMGGTDVRDEAVTGTMTFDGQGNVTGSFTQYGKFDSASSNATVSCTSGGNAVYFPPTPGTLTGTYSIQSTGDGTMNLTVSGGGGGGNPAFQMKLAGNCASGIANTVLFVDVKTNNAVDNTGIIRFQSTC